MSEKDRVTEGHRWLQHAKEDLVAATNGLTDGASKPRHVCSHAQQAAETSLRAALLLAGKDIPYTHDLDVLADLLPSAWWVRDARVDLRSLTRWAVEGRYPGEWKEPTEADAVKAMDWANQIHYSVRSEFDRRHGEAVPPELRQR